MSARDWDAVLYMASALAETVGVLVAIWDLSRAARRIREFLDDEPPVQIVATDYARLADSPAPNIGSGTPDQRLSALEQWQQGVSSEIDNRFERVGSELRLAMNAVYKTFMDRWREIKKFVRAEGQPKWRLYLGPILVFAGIVLGMVANLVNIYGLSGQ